MIVVSNDNGLNTVYVDRLAFVKTDSETGWRFKLGDNTSEQWDIAASSRGMSTDVFKTYYQNLCQAAIGCANDEWSFRYHVVATSSNMSIDMLQEIFDRAEEAFARNKAQQDKQKCQELLKRYISIGVIRMNGLKIQKYIFNTATPEQSRIVYDKETLSDFEFESLVPEKNR